VQGIKTFYLFLKSHHDFGSEYQMLWFTFAIFNKKSQTVIFMRIHFIAICGAAMHNLAIELHQKSYQVTGSDDEIAEPSRSRLQKNGLLPQNPGWFPEKITPETDVIILGMHAQKDNPELLRAEELGIKIYSYPEFLYEQTKDKTRVVIGGSHGKTTITSMVMHVLNYHKWDFDYMVGAQIEGFETMVRLNDTSKIAVFEGDEYLASPIDPRPKFHLYHPQIALLTGIAWDHINVFPTFEMYVKQFRDFAALMPDWSTLAYYEEDPYLDEIAEDNEGRLKLKPYKEHPAEIINNETWLITKIGKIKLGIFGRHNLQNLSGARIICTELGISDAQFYEAIQSFKGAARRLEVLAETAESTVLRDFAHSPSKLTATIEAVKTQFPERELVACMELHTFSSLRKEFLPQYQGSMNLADRAIVYFNPLTIEHKRLEPITPENVKEAFGQGDLEVFTDSDQLFGELKKINWQDKNLMLMSSGNFSGKDLPAFAHELLDENH
jgi:UDP-N-acetylmuramate: L-alanyl-gamma-D-glutamyl-meso-diaminopimelate ligase